MTITKLTKLDRPGDEMRPLEDFADPIALLREHFGGEPEQFDECWSRFQSEVFMNAQVHSFENALRWLDKFAGMG